jgi:antirestriction protein ArdC
MPTSTRKDEVLNDLVEGIRRLTTSERWQEWLKVQARFHRYSFNNTLLIQLQCHEATRVAGFQAWRKLGRNVRKGEKAIWILAPVTRKLSDDADSASGDKPKERAVVAFKGAAVFDIAQTDGEELPEVVTRLQGDDPGGAFTLLRGVAHAIGYSVEEDYLPGGRNGDCTFEERRIRVEVRNDEVQQVKTLAHELAHAILHEGFKDRALAELEAESVAFVVCAALGVNSADYTFGYVATWAGGGDEAISGIRAAGSRIQRTANDILTRIEAASAAGEEAA